MNKFISSLDKGELHVHLNGLIPVSIIEKILIEESINLPSSFNIKNDLLREFPMKNLEDYIKAWEVLRLIPTNRNNLRIMVNAAFENLKIQNVSFVELRNSVIYLSFINNISVEKALSWLIEEIELASSKYGINAGLILTVSRGDYSADNLNALINAYKSLGEPKSIIGLDLAGNENIILSNSISLMFREAKEKYGLKLTIHAGETGIESNIMDAIDNFKADRIGHGTAAGKNQYLMEYIAKNDVCIEVCPISNRLTGAVKEGDYHPVIEFIEHSVPFVLCSDNPAIHNKTINDDYQSFYDETKRKDILENMLKVQKKYSFIEGLT